MPITFADADDLDLDPFTARIEEIADDRSNPFEFVYDHYVHADGAHSFIVTDSDSEHANPRHNDGNLATLVNLHRNYVDLDESDSGVDEARERFYGYGIHGTTHPTYGRGQRDQKHDREYMVKRYVAMFREDILFYQDEWTVTGTSQGDWQNGYGFITKADWAEAMGEDYVGDITPEQAFAQELDIYGQYFAGEVYGCIYVTKGEPVFVIGEEGGYYTGGYEADEDSCWGFLGYADHKQITEQFTDSPVVEVLA